MAITEAFANSRSFSTGDSWSLPANATYAAGSPQTDDGIYQIYVDLNALVSGVSANVDNVEITVYEKVRSGDTTRPCMRFNKGWATGGEPIVVLPALILLHGWDVRLVATIASGTRTISWSIRKVA